ncbi:ACT domain-containing protein [Clostridium sp.]|uniref:ACT domain-containing protein n=1 Tax=Clostridium sp. TaxID=1506 RepID=UPI002601D5E7|nr:ACT domain-containing protein [Clostridium sp.]
MNNKILTMKLLKEYLAVCRLEKDDMIPTFATKGEFFSITKTEDELSLVCSSKNIPEGVKYEKDWRALKVEGPLDFSLIGILSSISSILAKNKISIFAVSTYDTDYILVKDKDLDNAIIALEKENYNIIK